MEPTCLYWALVVANTDLMYIFEAVATLTRPVVSLSLNFVYTCSDNPINKL